MLKRQLLPVTLALILVAVFGYGLLRLFQLRFERGDVYPPYSSLRTDPLGTKALHDALGEMSGMTVTRNYKSLKKLLNVDPDATILILGVPTFESITSDDFHDLMFLAARGHRVVLTLRSKTSRPKSYLKPGKEEADDEAAPSEEDEEEQEEEKMLPEEPDLRQVDVGFLEARENLRAVSAAPGLPAEIGWNSVVYFITPDPKWRLIYRVGEWPVLMERQYGDGSIVLASDTYFFSNEALRDDRHAALIAWLTGRHSAIVFDESHNGLSEDENVMTLVRKYNLRPLAFALALIAALFVWKAAVPFLPMPQRPNDEQEGAVMGKDSAAGFVNLLRRSVAPRELLATCVGYWKHTCGHRTGDWKDRIDAMDQVIREVDTQPARRRDPVEGYRKITRILAQKSEL